MANGISIVTGVSYTKGFKIPPDVRVHDGTLILIEPARDGVAGIPSQLVNYAAETAEAMVGSAVESLSFADTLNGNAGCLFERTARGGMHGVVRTTAFGVHATRARAAAVLPSSVYEYMRANSGHSFYFGMIGRVTRGSPAGSTGTTYALGGVNTPDFVASGPTRGLGVIRSVATGNVAGSPGSGSNFIKRRVSSVQPYFADIAISSNSLPEIGTLGAGDLDFILFGERVNSSNHVGWPSHIVYTAWLEDLTVSGRDYDAASAEGVAVFTQRFGTDGQYAGDSWTDPDEVT